jgi:predicted AlkP superfamily phosphohydrolase/phosphomutase
MLSDHGFGLLKTQVYLNRILQNMGYLQFNGPEPKSVDDINPISRAFAMDPSRIYLNSRDRFENGVITAGERDAIKARLKSELEALTLGDIGITTPDVTDLPEDKLFSKVFAQEEIYSGECFDSAPDIVLIPRPGYDLKATIGVPNTTMKDIFTGTHTHDDAFLLVNDPSIAQALPEPKITDVARLVTEVLL